MNLIHSQITLLKLLAKGISLKAAANQLGVKYNTVKTRTKVLYKKFNVKNRKDLISKAIKLNFIKTQNVKELFRKRFIYNQHSTVTIHEMLAQLSERHLKYLKLMAQGKSIKEVIEEVPLASRHDERYINKYICLVFQTKNLTQAVYIAKQMGII